MVRVFPPSSSTTGPLMTAAFGKPSPERPVGDPNPKRRRLDNKSSRVDGRPRPGGKVFGYPPVKGFGPKHVPTAAVGNPRNVLCKPYKATGPAPPVSAREPCVPTAAASVTLTEGFGCEYIITPGRHRININEFVLGVDRHVMAQHSETNPALSASAAYAQDVYHSWRAQERSIDESAYLLSFGPHFDIEKFRMMAVSCVFNYGVTTRLCQTTIHLAVTNINRLLLHRVNHAERQPLSEDLFACTVMAALRAAVKFEETPNQCDRFRLSPGEVWTASGFCSNINVDKSVEMLNKIEMDCLRILQHPINLPLAPEYLERYLVVGAWPEYVELFRDLGCFLLALALFAHGDNNPLRGVPPSKLSAAALVLAVKVINTDQNLTSYEFWPERLRQYTQYSLADLRGVIRGLSVLLRDKPPQARILDKVFPNWGEFDWN